MASSIQLGQVPSPRSPHHRRHVGAIPYGVTMSCDREGFKLTRGFDAVLMATSLERNVALGFSLPQPDPHVPGGEPHDFPYEMKIIRHGPGRRKRLHRFASGKPRPNHDLLRSGRHGNAL